MAFRKILKYPNSQLKKESIPVAEDEDVSGVVADLWDTLNVGGGVGLSAPQIGIHKRVIYVACDEYTGEMINPVIKDQNDLVGTWEGCLSFPGVREVVPRYTAIEVEFRKLDGSLCNVELSGLPAQIVQHEVDHLDGKLMLDYFSRMKRNMIIKKVNKVTKEVKSIMEPKEKVKKQLVRKTSHLSRKELKKRRKHRKLSR